MGRPTMHDPEPDAVDHPDAAPVDGATNISTEHQGEGDARLPSDMLDRGQASGTPPRDADEGSA